MRTTVLTLGILCSLVVVVASCEKINVDDILGSANNSSNNSSSGEGYTVTFTVDSYTLSDFDGDSNYPSGDSRAVVPAAELGTRLNLAVYQDGERVQRVNQTSDDSTFGTVSVTLDEGVYDFAILVHSGSGNATTTNPERITFTNNKVTDTFSAYNDGVLISENTAFNITLTRRVAMYRFIVEDAIPDSIAQMQFYYTGGSSTLSVVTGYGSVDSRQTEQRDVLSHDEGQGFEVYTFPHDKTGTLKMEVSALDSNGNVCHSVTYEGVPIERNKITIHSTPFFTTPSGTVEGTSGTAFTVTADNDWDGTLPY